MSVGLSSTGPGSAHEWLQRRYRPYMARLYRPPLGPLLSLLYRGDRVTCPCCARTARKFMPTVLPVGRNRPNARCPHCGARDRQRYMWLYLERKTNLLTDRLRVLHFAPERIFEDWLASRPNLDYVSTDLEREHATVKADITELPFADDSFDVILCSHVLEHVVDDRKAMRELYRVLRPGGWALVLVPIDFSRSETFEDPAIVAPADRERLFGQDDHVRIYGRDFATRLEEAGFTVHVEDFTRELGESEIRRYGLRPRKPDLHLCLKNESGAQAAPVPNVGLGGCSYSLRPSSSDSSCCRRTSTE